MAPNCPEWYLSSWAASFSGGLSAGIYYTNSPDVVAYITNHATTDILVLENLNLLQKILDGKPSIVEALPDVKHVVLIESDEEELLKGIFCHIWSFIRKIFLDKYIDFDILSFYLLTILF